MAQRLRGRAVLVRAGCQWASRSHRRDLGGRLPFDERRVPRRSRALRHALQHFVHGTGAESRKVEAHIVKPQLFECCNYLRP